MEQNGATMFKNTVIYSNIYYVGTKHTLKSKFKTFCKLLGNVLQKINKKGKDLVFIEFNDCMTSEKELIALYKGLSRYLKHKNICCIIQ